MLVLPRGIQAPVEEANGITGRGRELRRLKIVSEASVLSLTLCPHPGDPGHDDGFTREKGHREIEDLAVLVPLS